MSETKPPPLTHSQRARLGGIAIAAKVANGELPKDYYRRLQAKGGGRPRLRTWAEIEADPRGTKLYRDAQRAKGGTASKKTKRVQGTACSCGGPCATCGGTR